MHLPAATIRTQVMPPLRFADGFGTTARVYTFDGLADGPEHLALGPAVGGVCGSQGRAAGPDPQRVLHRRRPRERAVQLRAAGRSHRRGAGADHGAATKAGRGAHTLDPRCDDVLDVEA